MRRGEDWRGTLEWRNDDVPVSTHSNEAAKLYDAAITQYVGWYDDDQLGGLDTTIKNMLEADHTFVGGRALELGLKCLSSAHSARTDKTFAKEVATLKSDADKIVDLPYREKKHVQAVVNWSAGELYKAALAWEDVLLEHPTDILALKMASDTYFFLGRQFELRDSVARVMPFWTSRAIPLKSYLHGMYAFGLVETNFHAKAEMEAQKGLARNEKDGWATHALAHVLEMDGRADEGIAFMSRTLPDWQTSNHLACHNFWHWALYHVEKGELDAAGDIFETQILRRALKSKTMLDIHDCTSLPFRMHLDNSATTEKYIGKHKKSVYSLVEPHLNDHILAFNDAHFMMGCAWSKNFSVAEELIESARPIENISGKRIEDPLLKAILAYSREQYAEAVNLLYPIRYKLIDIGGSDAQRDVFHQLLIAAALKSPQEHHRKLVEHLIIERQAHRDNSPLTNRLTLKLLRNV